jgi:hypothetical protein
MILIALFLYLTISGVVKSNDIDIKTAKGVFEAGKVYALWLGEAFSNAKIITGNVISVVKSAGNHNSTITGKVSSSQGSGSSGSSNAGKVPRLS